MVDFSLLKGGQIQNSCNCENISKIHQTTELNYVSRGRIGRLHISILFQDTAIQIILNIGQKSGMTRMEWNSW